MARSQRQFRILSGRYYTSHRLRSEQLLKVAAAAPLLATTFTRPWDGGIHHTDLYYSVCRNHIRDSDALVDIRTGALEEQSIWTIKQDGAG